MAKKPKRQKAIKRLNLSDHTLDINVRRCNYTRDYQYDAIKQIMIYLWGGSYKSITVLGKENYKQKLQIQQRFGIEENFLNQLPLPDRLSGVVHMATGAGKSYIIFPMRREKTLFFN
jgi:type III restriction enzyme